MIAALSILWRLATSKAGMIGIAMLISLAALWWYGNSRYDAGWNDALATVARMNDAAAKAAGEAARTVTDCIDQGGSWNVSTGKCDR